MAAGDLTDIGRVKRWLFDAKTQASTASDALLSDLITSASAFVLNWINRQDVSSRVVVDQLDGSGNSFLLLRNYPVSAVIKVEFPDMGVTITTQATGNPRCNGILLESPPDGGGQQRLSLIGYCFPRGRSNVVVTYQAGFLAQAEPATIPTASPFTVSPRQMWLGEGAGAGVTFSDGTVLTKVTSPVSSGQYAVAAGVYTFAPADEGRAILISYSFAPSDLEMATRQLVGDQFRLKDRIGVVSQSVGGTETSSFSQKDMSALVKTTLQPYRRVTPA